jgi:hypothetical protein
MIICFKETALKLSMPLAALPWRAFSPHKSKETVLGMIDDDGKSIYMVDDDGVFICTCDEANDSFNVRYKGPGKKSKVVSIAVYTRVKKSSICAQHMI